MQKYYAMETNDDVTNLYIFGDITSFDWEEKDKSAYGIVKDLQDITSDKINVHINSYGGEVAEGLAIYNTLKNRKAHVTTYCDGFACSSASVVFMAGDERIMNSASLLMIHNAWTVGMGNAKEFRKQADDLDKISSSLINSYMENINISEDELKELMDNESWLTAEDAVDKGFANKINEQKETGIAASAMNSIRNKVLMDAQPVETLTVDIDDIVDKVVDKLKPIFNQMKLVDQSEEKINEPEDSTGFGAFFMNNKEM